MLAQILLAARNLAISKDIHKIASDTGCRLVCTFDAFADYCAEAEEALLSEEDSRLVVEDEQTIPTANTAAVI